MELPKLDGAPAQRREALGGRRGQAGGGDREAESPRGECKQLLVGETMVAALALPSGSSEP